MNTHSQVLPRWRWAFGLAGVALALLSVVAVPARSFAMTVPLTVSQRTSLASAVFVGTVGAEAPRLRGKDIVTGFGVRTSASLKGQAPRRVDLMGGTMGSREQWVSDQPELDTGKTYLFFLDDQGRAIGGPQGAVEVRNGRLAYTDVSVNDIAGAVTAATLPPQQSRAFPELRTSAGRTAAFAAIDASIAAGATDALAATENTAAATAGPTITAISPDVVAAGTGTTVEIDGTGFGTTPGTLGKIEVMYDPHRGGPFARWRVSPTGWTNTRITFRVPIFFDLGGYPGAAGTGPVRITTASGLFTDSPSLRVTYAFDGDSWDSTPINVYANPDGATPSQADTLAMLQGAISTWASGGFALHYAGLSNASGNAVHGNGVNEISWSNLPAGILAQASWYPDASGHLREQNIVFNTAYTWGDGTSGSYDIQSIALHELGHWIILRDKYSPYDSAQIMYGYGKSGEQKRVLTQAELDGINYVYGSDRLAPTTSVSVVSSGTFLGPWTSGDVTVTLTPPGDANLRGTHYRIDYAAAESISATAAIPFVAEGYHDVMCWSTDDAGNNEVPVHRTVAIDRTAPTSSSDATSTYAGSAAIKFSATDALSGLSKIQWRLVGSPTWTTGTTASFPTSGPYTLEFRALDKAGNAEDPHVVAFDVLLLQPAALQLRTRSRNVKYGTAVSIDGTLSVSGTGLPGQRVGLQSSVNGTTWTTLTTQLTVGGDASRSR